MTEVKPDAAKVGDELPKRAHTCDEIQSFFYNAVLWNAHKIHYDLPYATEVEGYEGLVVPGPLMGDWLTQIVEEWIDDTTARLKKIEYSNRQAAFVGQSFEAGGQVVECNVVDGETVISVELFVKNSDGELLAPGKATVVCPL